MKTKHRRGPCPDRDKKWVMAWCDKKHSLGHYQWVVRLHRSGSTWHQIRSHIAGKGY